MIQKRVSSDAKAESSQTIVVVGGGSVGTSFLRQLSDQIAVNQYGSSVRRVILFEPNSNPGAGEAYQLDTPSNLLNTRVASMSPIASDSQHFHRWLLDNMALWRPQFPDLEPTADSFVPRALFGIYLGHVFDDAVVRLRAQGVTVEHVPHRVSTIRRVGDRYVMVTAQGVSVQSAGVVLAIGNLETQEWDHLRANPGYFNTPYPCTKLISEIGATRSVCILGTSLSAIDAAVSLSDAGHTGKIIMVSRNGRLPSVRGEQNLNRKPNVLTRERIQALAEQRGVGTITLTEIAQMLLQELQICEGRLPRLDDIMRTGEGPHRYLDSEISEAQVQDRAWQAIVYALNDSIDLIWHMLSAAEKRVFQAKFKSLWLSYRVSFPIQNARKIQQLLHRDQLTVYGGYRDAYLDDANGRFAISVADASKGFEATLYADSLINATAYTSQVSMCRSPLLRSMVANGLVRPSEFGGIDVDFDTGRVVSRSGAQMSGLYALGSLACGTYFWTNAMNVNTRLAAGVAGKILGDCYSAAQQAVDDEQMSVLELAAGRVEM